MWTTPPGPRAASIPVDDDPPGQVSRTAGGSLGAVPGAVTTIAAPVEMIEPTGAETIFVLRLGDERALGRVSPDLRPRLGERALFAVDTRKISLFSPASGDRIT